MPKFHLTLTRRVWALALIALATMALGTGLALNEFNNLNLDQRRAELRHEVEVAVTLMKSSGASLDKPETIRAALERLRPIRFGDAGYFFALDMDGVTLLSSGAPTMEGKSLLGLKDLRGRFPFQEMVNTAKTMGSGFVAYPWKKPGVAVEQEKTSFIQAMPELGVMIGSGVYFDDVLAQIIGVAARITAMVAPLLALFLGLSWLIGHTVSRRLFAMTSAMREMAQGNYDIVLPGLDRQDELAEMAREVEKFKLGLQGSAEAQSAQRAESRKAADETRAGEMRKLAQRFEMAVGAVVEAVGKSTHDLENVARSLVQEARYSGEQADAGAQAAEIASHNVQSVAAAAEQLTYSVEEIGNQASRSQTVSSHAAREAAMTRSRMDELIGAIEHIGGIVAMITGIAQQTNMLALNATIEAARAGEQGRGFAVVAQEVKSLAEQTTRATADVAEQIASVQRASQEASGCIGAMTEATDEVNSIASSIATSVQSQGEATREIAHNVQETAQKTEELNRVIEEVRSASRQSGTSAEQVLKSVTELAGQTQRLRVECEGFLTQVRAA